MVQRTWSFVLDALCIGLVGFLAGCGGFGVGGTVDLDVNGYHYQITGGSKATQTAPPTSQPAAQG